MSREVAHSCTSPSCRRSFGAAHGGFQMVWRLTRRSSAGVSACVACVAHQRAAWDSFGSGEAAGYSKPGKVGRNHLLGVFQTHPKEILRINGRPWKKRTKTTRLFPGFVMIIVKSTGWMFNHPMSPWKLCLMFKTNHPGCCFEPPYYCVRGASSSNPKMISFA